MKNNIKEAVERYQCPGCVVGSDTSCYDNSITVGVGCGSHKAGTIINSIGTIFLGMPKGFNRFGKQNDMVPRIFEKFDNRELYDMWNIPVWKHLTEDGQENIDKMD